MRNKENFNWSRYIKECLLSTDYCALATVDLNNGAWSNPVYFAWDNNYNFYFISQPHSRHMKNILKNKRVSLAIYSTAQKGDVLGIQLEGNAKVLRNKKEISHAFRIYHGRTGGGPDVQHYIEDPSWLFVKITPRQMYYFDTRFFDEERQEVPLKKLRS